MCALACTCAVLFRHPGCGCQKFHVSTPISSGDSGNFPRESLQIAENQPDGCQIGTTRRDRTRSERKDHRRSGTGPLRSTPPPHRRRWWEIFRPWQPGITPEGGPRAEAAQPGGARNNRLVFALRRPERTRDRVREGGRRCAPRRPARSAGVEPRRGACTSCVRCGGRLPSTSGAIGRRRAERPWADRPRSPKVERAEERQRVGPAEAERQRSLARQSAADRRGASAEQREQRRGEL